MKQNLITLGLAALLGGCAPAYGVKEEAPVKVEATSPADDGVSAKLIPRNGFYHDLGSQEHLTVQYLSSPLTPWDVKAVVRHYSDCSVDAVWGKEAVSDAEYACWGRVNDNGYFITHECDSELPEGLQELVEMRIYSGGTK